MLPFLAAAAFAMVSMAPLLLAFAPAMDNPDSPRMGDRICSTTIFRYVGLPPFDGVIAGASLMQVDTGEERLAKLESWRAHKVISDFRLAPGEALRTDWPMRLIAAEQYRVVISVADRSGVTPTSDRFAGLIVQGKPVVDSARVLPVALGMPLILGTLLVLRRRRGAT